MKEYANWYTQIFKKCLHWAYWLEFEKKLRAVVGFYVSKQIVLRVERSVGENSRDRTKQDSTETPVRTEVVRYSVIVTSEREKCSGK